MIHLLRPGGIDRPLVTPHLIASSDCAVFQGGGVVTSDTVVDCLTVTHFTSGGHTQPSYNPKRQQEITLLLVV